MIPFHQLLHPTSSAPKRNRPTRTSPDGDSRAETLSGIGYQEAWSVSSSCWTISRFSRQEFRHRLYVA